MIAKETKLPVMIYNVPSRTSKNIEVETVVRLSAIDNIIAVKEASGNAAQIANISRKTPDDFYVYSGDDNFTLPTLSVGGQGIISVASHLVGNQIQEMVKAYKRGDINQAAQLNKELGEIFSGIFITTNPIPVKAAMNMMKMEVGSLRPPLIELDDSKKEVLKDILRNQKLI
jgi:4-hydroxy-tetrahydrodipicolinate synthase